MDQIEIFKHPFGFQAATIRYDDSESGPQNGAPNPADGLARISISHDGVYATAICFVANTHEENPAAPTTEDSME